MHRLAGCGKENLCNPARFGTIRSIGISLKQFQDLQRRLKGTRKDGAQAGLRPAGARKHSVEEIILGIDPSLRGTGYGVVKLSKSPPQCLDYGTVTCPANWERSRCFLKIAQELRIVLEKHRPTTCVIEGLFYAQNLQTALIMGEARGAAMVVIAEAGLDIYELAPRKVKQAIVGYGAAQKSAVAKMVQRILKLEDLPSPDAADALALALAHAQARTTFTFNPRKL